MYWLVEDEEQLSVLINSGYKEAFIEVIPYNFTIHPAINKIALLYIRPINATKGYMICMHHSEALNALNTQVDMLLDNFNVLYCRDKKEILHYLPLKTLYDINPPPTTYIRPTTNTHDLYYRKHGDNPELNLIIPIVKHYELCEQIFSDLKSNINNINELYGKFYNDKTTMVFNAIERSGIRIHKPTFEKHFHPINSEYTYSQYNLKTTTTRPSNRFKNVNYAALNKENGCRKSFIPRNNKFIEIDISAYHPSLAAKLIDYKFPTQDIHGHFASLYNVDYKKAKELTFKQLYGGVFDNYKDLEFFSKIERYINNLWKDFKENGWVECKISGYHFEDNGLENMNPQKLFNYILQNLETSTNVLILWDILCILRGCKTKLVLYTYDSFLLDYDEKEDIVLQNIRSVFDKYGLNIKENNGYDYNFTG